MTSNISINSNTACNFKIFSFLFSKFSATCSNDTMTSVWGRSTGISPKLVDIDNVPCVDATNSTPGRKTSVGKLHQYSIWQGLPGPCEDEEGLNLPSPTFACPLYKSSALSNFLRWLAQHPVEQAIFESRTSSNWTLKSLTCLGMILSAIFVSVSVKN